MTSWRKRQILDMAEKSSPSNQDWWKDDDALERFAALVREDEREACAKVCEDSVEYAGDELARQIRARGNT